MKQVMATLLAIAVLAAGCGAAEPTQTAEPSPAQAADAATEVDETAVEGTWRTETFTREQVEDYLRSAGFADVIQPLRANLPDDEPPQEENVYTLHLRDGAWRLEWETPEIPRHQIDEGGYTVDGDTITYVHGDEPPVTYRWRVDSDTLSLEPISEFPDEELWPGIPVDAFVRTLYSAVPFHRVEG